MPWISRLLRGDRVWARAGADGSLQTGGDGRVDIVYSREGGKVYRASSRNLAPDPAPDVVADGAMRLGASTRDRGTAAAGKPGSPGAVGSAATAAPAADPIIVYADGACSGNPGPAGLGIVILDGNKRDEVSENLGNGTNNIAELMAIVRALERLPRERTIVLHSDSAYALGLLGQGWKAKANQQLVQRMRSLASEFRDLRLVKVAGHAGIVENERADALARAAIAPQR